MSTAEIPKGRRCCMNIYLGLGSNDGDRKSNIFRALSLLKSSVQIKKISPLYENPALLPEHYDSSWNRPFLNLALKGAASLSIENLFSFIQSIEHQLGRRGNRRQWSPRAIDIDILFVENIEQSDDILTVPHPALTKRDFVLSPLRDIEPSLEIKGRSILQLSRKLKNKLPAWMDILNLTPDSFSDGGGLLKGGSSEHRSRQIKEKIKLNEEFFVQLLDIGGYSTRPSALDIDVEEEWRRIYPVFEILQNMDHSMKISVDTFRAEIAKRALKCGADTLNDVSGLSDPQMIDVLKDSDSDYILMHSLSVPADRKMTFSEKQNPVQEIQNWLEQKLNFLEKNKIHLKRVIFDPGIGFGKTSQQSLDILKNIEVFMKYPVRLMAGHSRKSFMSAFSKVQTPALRDFESVGISMELAGRGVDIIRVHDASKHARAWLAQKHIS